jgi:hypothetical protein
VGELSIEIVDGKKSFEPGETVEVRVGWDLEPRPDAIELRTAWTTVGMGTPDTSVVSAQRIDDPKTIDGRLLRFDLPREPFSFSGKLVSLVWFLEVVAFPSREGRQVEITIGPGGREILLHEVL